MLMESTTTRGAMSVAEFQHWASIGRSKLYQEISAGRLQVRKIGRKTVVTMREAEAWLANLPSPVQRHRVEK
ncbi:DNA-binding protein [Mesorhizobium australicum]|uniref:DNA-binding protein n=1 Tax=Mesorhizobium australicum TaxID=536018 RepID=UPI00333C384B